MFIELLKSVYHDWGGIDMLSKSDTISR
jgi:hypothetical protein